MAHEIENMFSVKEVPWHGLGHVIQDAPSVDQVLQLAGLNWQVTKRQLSLDGKLVDQYAMVRETDQTVLGFAGKRYEPIQNVDILNFFAPFAESGLVDFETAGSLREGKKVWIMARLNSGEMDIVKGDTVRKYLMLSSGHDGLTAATVAVTPVRVVCANTLAIALRDAMTSKLKVSHSKKALVTLDSIRDIVNVANASFEATAEQYRALAKTSVKKGDLENYVDLVFYNGKQAETDREKVARESLYSEINRLFEVGHGNEMQGVRGTVWGLYNGVTQYLSYEAGRSQDTRLDSLWFGAAKGTNEAALEHAMALAV